MNRNKFYFVLYSNTSRHNGGLDPQVMWVTEEEIIVAAAEELARRGESLEDLAGVGWVEDKDGNFHPERELTDEEVLTLSVEKLGDDGRLFVIFDTTKEGATAFIDAAEYYWMGDEARKIVEELNV